jgi:hypothetical protein
LRIRCTIFDSNFLAVWSVEFAEALSPASPRASTEDLPPVFDSPLAATPSTVTVALSLFLFRRFLVDVVASLILYSLYRYDTLVNAAHQCFDYVEQKLL